LLKGIFGIFKYEIFDCFNGLHPNDFSFTKSNDHKTDSYFCIEKFTDSFNIGLKGQTKVEIENFRNRLTEDNLIVLKFFRKYSFWGHNKRKSIRNERRETNRFYLNKDGITAIDTEISEFNNDGFQDFSYRSGVAARGETV